MPATKPMRALSSRLGLAALTGTALLAAVVGLTAPPATGMPSEAQGASEATARTVGSACASDAEGAAVSAYVRAHRDWR